MPLERVVVGTVPLNIKINFGNVVLASYFTSGKSHGKQHNNNTRIVIPSEMTGVRFSVVVREEEGSKAINWDEERNRANRGCADREERKVRVYDS